MKILCHNGMEINENDAELLFCYVKHGHFKTCYQASWEAWERTFFHGMNFSGMHKQQSHFTWSLIITRVSIGVWLTTNACSLPVSKTVPRSPVRTRIKTFWSRDLRLAETMEISKNVHHRQQSHHRAWSQYERQQFYTTHTQNISTPLWSTTLNIQRATKSTQDLLTHRSLSKGLE